MVSTRRKGLLAVVALFAALLVGLFGAAQTAWAEEGDAEVIATAELTATKTLDGEKPAADQFEFTIKAKDPADAPMPANTTAKNDAEGKISFGVASYTKEGTYVYEVTETKGSDSTIIYDTTPKEIKVVVKANDATSSTAPDNGWGYTPTKHTWSTSGSDDGSTARSINFGTYSQGDTLANYTTKKTVNIEGVNEYVFCGANYKSASESSYNKVALFWAEGDASYKPWGVNWAGSLMSSSDGGNKQEAYPKWLDRVAFLYSKDYANIDSSNASGAWNTTTYPYVLTQWSLRDAVQKVLWNAFPYNAAGFKSTGDDLYVTTQMALFFVLRNGGAYQSEDYAFTLEDDDTFREIAPNKDDFDALVKYALSGTQTDGYSFENYTEGKIETYVYWNVNNDGDVGSLTAQPLIGVYADYTPPAFSTEVTPAEFANKKAAEPKITNTTAKVNNTATSVELAAGDQGTFTDEVTFENLDADKTYTVVSTLMKDGEQFDQVTTNDVSGASLTVTFDKKITEAGKYSVKTELKDGDTVITHNGDLDVASETVNVTVKQPDSKVPTVATSASGTVEPAENQTITDTITLTNLIEGVKYTITGKLMDKEKKDVVAGATSDPDPLTFTATADEAAAESVTKTMTFTFDASALAGKDVVVFETLTWEGDAHGDTNEVKHENYDDGGQTVTVGTSEEPPKNPENPDKDNPGGNGDVITTGKHPSLKTTVKVDGTAADAGKVLVVEGSAYQAIKLVDTIDYADLEAGESYTVRGTVMKFPGGTVVKTARATLTAAAASGTWELDFGVVPIEPDSYYVVYEYASDSTGKEVAKHENPTDVAQAVLVTVVDEDWPIIVENPGVVNDSVPVTGLEMATTVSINGKAASAEQARTVSYADASKVKNVTDTITYSGFEPGATYTIAGNLVDVAAGKVVATASVEQVASDTGDGTWTVEFTGVTLEPGKKYVVCEYAYDADNNLVAQHEDFSDLAQTIVVTAKPTASPATGGKTTAKTADDMGGLVLGIAILALLSSGVVVYARRKAMR